MSKHTPGPWHVIHEPTLGTFHVRVEDLDAAPVASLFYSSGGARPQLSRELVNANASLIAAAPELFELLAAVLHRLDLEAAQRGPGVQFPCAAMRDDIRAALAKAQGGGE